MSGPEPQQQSTGKRPPHRRTKRDVAATLRAEQALALRKAGHSYDAIAKAVGFADKASCWNAVQRQLERVIAPVAEDVHQLELLRCDDYLKGIYRLALSGDLDAIATALRIGERRARLLGLDKVQDQGTGASITIVEVDSAIAQGV